MIDPTLLLWPFFWLGFITAFCYAFGLIYHWVRYGHMYPFVWVVMPIYSLGTLLFLGAMLAGIGSV